MTFLAPKPTKRKNRPSINWQRFLLGLRLYKVRLFCINILVLLIQLNNQAHKCNKKCISKRIFWKYSGKHGWGLKQCCPEFCSHLIESTCFRSLSGGLTPVLVWHFWSKKKKKIFHISVIFGVFLFLLGTVKRVMDLVSFLEFLFIFDWQTKIKKYSKKVTKYLGSFLEFFFCLAPSCHGNSWHFWRSQAKQCNMTLNCHVFWLAPPPNVSFERIFNTHRMVNIPNQSIRMVNKKRIPYRNVVFSWNHLLKNTLNHINDDKIFLAFCCY